MILYKLLCNNRNRILSKVRKITDRVMYSSTFIIVKITMIAAIKLSLISNTNFSLCVCLLAFRPLNLQLPNLAYFGCRKCAVQRFFSNFNYFKPNYIFLNIFSSITSERIFILK